MGALGLEREAEACTDVLGLLATVAYADARINHERQSNQALLRIGAKAVRKYADAALDAEAAEMFRTVAGSRRSPRTSGRTRGT